MPELYTAVANMVRIFSFAIALYFFVGLVVNMAQAHLAGATGDTIGYARALQQGIAMVIMLAVAVNANAIAGFLETLAGSPDPRGGRVAVLVFAVGNQPGQRVPLGPQQVAPRTGLPRDHLFGVAGHRGAGGHRPRQVVRVR